MGKNNDDECHLWESAAGGTFSVAKYDDEALKRGTRIICHLKDDQLEYLEERRIKDLVKKHSEFIGYPIQLQVEKTSEKEVTDDEEEEEEKKEEEKKEGDEPEVKEVKEGDEKKRREKREE